MEFQIALNTLISIMMIVFPGFLFRKFYYRGEFTKQFAQATQFDKFIWNVFFSIVAILITFFSIFTFKEIFELKLLDSINYESITELLAPLSINKIPRKAILLSTYKDILLLMLWIYTYATFLGLISHWFVRELGLDVKFPLFRFKNYWYYYIHGERILYSNKTSKKKRDFTAVDLLCEQAGETMLYSGIISQYTINKDDNNLENIFITNAYRYHRFKDERGNVQVNMKEIPGAVFCVPYNKVLNMNLIYVFKENEARVVKWVAHLINILFVLSLTALVVSLWFDLSPVKISGFWSKTGYFTWTFIALANLRLLAYNIASKNSSDGSWIGQVLLFVSAVGWLLYITAFISFWLALLTFVIAIVATAVGPE